MSGKIPKNQTMEVYCATLAQLESFVNVIDSALKGNKISPQLLAHLIELAQTSIQNDLEVHRSIEKFEGWKKESLEEFFDSDDGRRVLARMETPPSNEVH